MMKTTKGNQIFLSFLLMARLGFSDVLLNERYVGAFDAQITAAPMLKRDTTDGCPANYNLCPASLDGGCCPSDRSCGVSSCYLTTATQSACGVSGYFACGIDEGGGCCPSGYTCNVDGCTPPPGSTYSQSCAPSSYLCASTFGYGCCHNSLACGVGYCYATTYDTVVLTLTLITTDSNAQLTTVTTVETTAYQPSSAQPLQTTSLPKYTPVQTAVAKVAATSAPTSNSNSLTSAALGGIIASAILVLLAVILATWLILRRLRKVAKQEAEIAEKSRSGSNTRYSRGTGATEKRPAVLETSIDYDNMSVDPLMMSGPTSPVPRPSAAYSDFEHNSPPIPAPYKPVLSDHGGYFDPYLQMRDQNLRFGHLPERRPSVAVHGRQWSDASDVSQQSGHSTHSGVDSHIVPELEAGLDGDRRSSLQRAMQGMGLGRLGSRGHRRRTSSVGSAGVVRQELDGTSIPATRLGGMLEEVSEAEHNKLAVIGETRKTSNPEIENVAQETDLSVDNENGDVANSTRATASNLLREEFDPRENQKILGMEETIRRFKR